MSKELLEEYILQGKMLINEGNYTAALEYLDKAEEEDNMELEIYMQKGLALANLEKYAEAEVQYKKVLKLNKNNAIAYFHLGNLELLQGNKVQGIEYYNNAIAKGFDDAQIYYSLGLQYEEDGNIDFALRNYSKALLRDPQRAEIRLRKIKLFDEMNQRESAIEEANALILSNPDIFEGYHFKAILLIEENKYEEAKKVIEEARLLFPKDANFVIDLATLEENLGNIDKAYEILEEARAYEGVDASELRKIEIQEARIFANKNNTEETIKHLENARDVVASLGEEYCDEEALFLLINCYLGIERYEDALNSVHILKNRESESYYVFTSVFYEALTLKRMNNPEGDRMLQKSVEHYRAISLNEPENLDAYFYRVMSLNELGQFEKALDLIKFLEQLKGNLPQVQQLKETTLAKKELLEGQK